MDQYIECRVCGKQLKAITNSHLRGHDMTFESYFRLFPDAPIRSALTHAQMCASAAIANADQERRMRQSIRMSGSGNPFFGKKHDDPTRQKISGGARAGLATVKERLSAIRKGQFTGDKNPNWKGGVYRDGGKKARSRWRALDFYGARCMIPGCEFDFVVHNHHIHARAAGGSYGLENCIVLCPNHHAMADAGYYSEEYLYGLIAPYLNAENERAHDLSMLGIWEARRAS